MDKKLLHTNMPMKNTNKNELKTSTLSTWIISTARLNNHEIPNQLNSDTVFLQDHTSLEACLPIRMKFTQTSRELTRLEST